MQRWIKPVQFAVAGFTAGFFIRKVPLFQPEAELLEWSRNHAVVRENWYMDYEGNGPPTKSRTGGLKLYKRDRSVDVVPYDGGESTHI